MFNNKAHAILEIAKAKGITLAIAESCTGGMLCSEITAIPGSSEVFDRGFITYSYEAKTEILGVSTEALKAYGAVSKEVAYEMAQGAVENSKANFSVAITGIAGPGGATDKKPIGLVHFCINNKGAFKEYEIVFPGDRAEIRKAAVEFILDKMLEVLLD